MDLVSFWELRTKVIKVYIDNGRITVTNYFGLGSTKYFEFSEFEGFETSLVPSKYETYEYLFLLENGKKVVKLSQFYHNNYIELKTALIDKVRNLGQKDYSIFRELQEIFV